MKRFDFGRGWAVSLTVFGLVFCLWGPAPTLAQDAALQAAGQTVAVEDIEALAAAIEDESKRAELLTHLRALTEVAKKKKAETKPQSFGPRLIARLSAGASEASRQLVEAANSLSDLPVLAAWIQTEFSNVEARNAWLRAFLKLALIIAVGAIAEWLVGRLMANPRRSVEGREIPGILVRVPMLLARTVMDILPVAAFAVAAYIMLPLLNPGPRAQVLVVTFLNAYLLIRAAVILMRMVLVPGVPALRLFPIGGETANYLFIWTRRLIVVWGGGYYFAEAALFLGLPAGGYEGLLRLVGLLVTTMLVVFVLQNRQGVARWIRGGRRRDAAKKSASARLRRRFADVWHVLAIVYVIGVFAVWALEIEGGFEYLFRSTLASAVILGVAKLATVGLRRAIERGFAVREEVRARFPMLEARVNRYVPLIHLVLRTILYIVIVIALMQAWGIDAFGWLDSPLGRRVASSAFSIAFVLVGALILWEAISSAIERYLSQTDAAGNVIERGARARTLLPLLRNAIMVVLLVMVVLIVLSEFGINIGPLLAGAGVIGLAIGFGSQKLVQDVITGAFILFEDSISVGNVVTAGGISGVVEQLSIRSIRLRDLSGNVHTIPFSSVDTVTNMTKEFSMAVIEAGVAYRESVDEVMEVLKKLGGEFQEDPEFGPLVLEPLDMLGVDALGDSAVIIKCRFKTVPMKQWAVRREFTRRMKNRFDELGIEIPFPHQTLYFGQDKDGAAPPAFVRTEPARRAPATKKQKTDDAEPQTPTTDLPSASED